MLCVDLQHFIGYKNVYTTEQPKRTVNFALAVLSYCLSSIGRLLFLDVDGFLCRDFSIGSLHFGLHLLFLKEFLGSVEGHEEADGDDQFGEDEGDEAEADQLQFEFELEHRAELGEQVAQVGWHLADEAEDEAVEQADAWRHEVTPVHLGAELQREEFDELRDALKHQQSSQQLRDVGDDVGSVGQQHKAKEAGVCYAKGETNGVMHIFFY